MNKGLLWLLIMLVYIIVAVVISNVLQAQEPTRTNLTCNNSHSSGFNHNGYWVSFQYNTEDQSYNFHTDTRFYFKDNTLHVGGVINYTDDYCIASIRDSNRELYQVYWEKDTSIQLFDDRPHLVISATETAPAQLNRDTTRLEQTVSLLIYGLIFYLGHMLIAPAFKKIFSKND